MALRDKEKEDMYTCKWCYKQVIPNLEDKHFECKKKIKRQRQIRKSNIDGLASASDKRFIGATNKTSLRVIGSRSRLEDK
jgi:hypothetical protein